jgi:hypothetical protein
MKVTVIGNGVSRAPIPLDKITGITIGCNEIHTHFQPDYLTAVDSDMIKEIWESDYAGTVYYRHLSLARNKLAAKPFWYTPDFMQNNCSGIGGIHIALHLKATEIDLLGFDCKPGRIEEYGPHKSNGEYILPSFDLWINGLLSLNKFSGAKLRRVVGPKSLDIPDIPSISVEDYIKELDK